MCVADIFKRASSAFYEQLDAAVKVVRSWMVQMSFLTIQMVVMVQRSQKRNVRPVPSDDGNQQPEKHRCRNPINDDGVAMSEGLLPDNTIWLMMLWPDPEIYLSGDSILLLLSDNLGAPTAPAKSIETIPEELIPAVRSTVLQ